MPTKVEKDAYTGTDTTGHEWDGIKELNTPLPRWWLYVFYACIIWSVGIWVLYPALPTLSGYTAGMLGEQRRVELQQEIAAARDRQGDILARMDEAGLEEIVNDQALLSFATHGGEAAFADNCVACHGLGGAGLPGGYPVLADDDWLWGGTLDAIHETLLVGIRHDSDDTRFSEMPAYRGVLEPDQIGAVTNYVLSLSGSNESDDGLEDGAEIFAEQCAACHGDNGDGDPDQGAPRLNDQIWLYGGTAEQVTAQINRPQHGVMPGWTERLDPTTIKMLTVYVHGLGGGQ